VKQDPLILELSVGSGFAGGFVVGARHAVPVLVVASVAGARYMAPFLDVA